MAHGSVRQFGRTGPLEEAPSAPAAAAARSRRPRAAAIAITCIISPAGSAWSPRTTPLSAKTEVATNEQTATVASPASGLRRASARTRPARMATSTKRQRPAPGHVVGGRREVEQEPGEEADDGTELRAAGDRGGDHDDQGEVGHHAVDGEQVEHGHLQDDREHDHDGRPVPARERFIGCLRLLDSPLITRRSPWVLRGTTTPTTSSEVKSTNGSITACLASSRGVEYTDSTLPIGMPGDVGHAVLAAPGHHDVALGGSHRVVDEVEVEAAAVAGDPAAAQEADLHVGAEPAADDGVGVEDQQHVGGASGSR